MKKVQFAFLAATVLLGSCSVMGGNANKPFVWPAAWSDARGGEAKYGGEFHDEYIPALTSNPFTDQDNAGTHLYLSDGTTGLYRQDPLTMRFVPYMALSLPSISADGRVYTFKLRQNMKFSDGTPITAQDFVNTWKIHTDKDVGSIIRGEFFNGDQPVTLQALDAQTLQVNFPVRMATAEKVLTFAPWPSHIFWKAYQQGGAKAVAALWGPDAKASEFVTAGAWVPSVMDNKVGGQMVFVKNKYWGEWNKDSSGRALPYLDRVVRTLLADDADWFQPFLDGKVDEDGAYTPEDMKAIEDGIAAGKLNVTLLKNASPRNSVRYIAFNWNRSSDPHKQALFRDVRFRHAFSHLVNRQRIVDEVFGGMGQPLYSTSPLLHKDFIPADLPKYPYDPAAAAKLLAEMGYTKNASGDLVNAAGKGISFEVLSYNDPLSLAFMNIIAADAKAAGIHMTVKGLPYEDMYAVLTPDPAKPGDRPFDAIFFANAGYSTVLPFDSAMVNCTGEGHDFNRSGQCLDPLEERMQTLLAQAQQELDPAKRLAIGQEMNRVGAELMGMVPLFSPSWSIAYNNRLGGALPRSAINAYNLSRLLPLTFIK